MRYNITKKITAKRQAPGAGIYLFFIALVAVPVIAIAFFSLLLQTLFTIIVSTIKPLVIKRRNEMTPEPFYLELDLLHNRHIKIQAIEDETDKELTELNEQWSEEAYHAETYLYRAKTIPLIPALEGKIICFFLKEQPGGALLQMVEPDQSKPLPSTKLVFIYYDTLQVTTIESIGLFHLYNDEKNDSLIKGFNNKEELKLYFA